LKTKTSQGFRNRKSDKTTRLDDSTESEASVGDEDVFKLKKDTDEFLPVEGDPGLYYKV